MYLAKTIKILAAKRLCFVAWVVMLLTCIPAHSQINSQIKTYIEKYLETAETTADYTQILEDLSGFLEKPINLNTATLDQLLRFPLILPNQALLIEIHRRKYGNFLHLAELQVLGFSPDQINAIQPFVSIDIEPKTQWRDLVKNLPQGDAEWITTIKQKYPNDKNPAYIGNMLSQNIRMRYSKPGFYSFGISADKDAGEKYWNKGPDFFTGHAAFYNIGKIKHIILGDYLLSVGQGLLMGSGIGMGKSAMVLNIKRTAPELKPYRGVNEYFFQRGIATQIQFKKWDVLFAVSKNKTDVTLTDTNGFGEIYFSSVDLDGYHRTQKEIANKHNNLQTMAGGWIGRRNKRGHWGIGGNYTHTEKSLQASKDLYKFYYPSGNNLNFLNFYQSHTIGRIHAFSEWVWCSTNRTTGMIAGILTALGKNIDLSILYRNYAPGFVSRYNTAFGNSNQNEKGLYTGIQWKFSRKLVLNHYTDFWVNPWLGYRIYGIGRGTDMLWQLEYSPVKKSHFYIRFRSQNKPASADVQQPYKTITTNQIQTVRIHFEVPINKNAEFQMRGESNKAHFGNQNYLANLTFFQFATIIPKTRSQISARYNLFDVPWYYARIFAFESQLMYDFGTMAFYGKGQSLYILLHQKINKHWKTGIRYALQNSKSPAEIAFQTKQSIFVQLIYQE